MESVIFSITTAVLFVVKFWPIDLAHSLVIMTAAIYLAQYQGRPELYGGFAPVRWISKIIVNFVVLAACCVLWQLIDSIGHELSIKILDDEAAEKLWTFFSLSMLSMTLLMSLVMNDIAALMLGGQLLEIHQFLRHNW